MSRRNLNKNRRALVLALSCCLVLLVIIAALLHINERPRIAALEDSVTTSTVEKNPDSIAVPGYEILEVKAGTKKQSLCLPNPEQNMCYFQISLYLEDGTMLWQSDLIEPGKTSKPVVLTQVLDKGTYPNAVLRYSCYRMDDDLTPLNGAETKLTLRVK